MAITKTVSNRFKFEVGKGAIDFSSDTFKAVLMEDGFVFDKDSHGQLSDISADIISSAGGYEAKTLAVDTAWNQDDTNDLAFVDWVDLEWVATGANFDDFVGIAVYDDSHSDKVIVGYIDLDQVVTLVSGNSFLLQNLGFEALESAV